MDRFESRMTPRFLAESEKDVVRAKSNWVREGNSGRSQGRWKPKEKSFCFVVVKFELIFGHSCFYVIYASVHSSLRGVDIWSCASSTKSWWFTEWLAMIPERGVVYRTKRMGPSTEPWGTLYMSCDGEEDELLTEVDWYLSEKYDWNHWNAVDWMPKTEFSRRGEFGGQQCQKLQKDPIKEEQRCCHCPEQRETIYNPDDPVYAFLQSHTL